jgi:hypothetical protein
MISPNLYAIWVFLLMNLSQDLKCFLLRYFGTLGDGYSLKGSNKKPSRHKLDVRRKRREGRRGMRKEAGVGSGAPLAKRRA